MKMNVYAMMDRRSNLFGSPWLDVSDEMAARRVAMMQDPVLDRFPEDFCVVVFGSFDTQNGVFDQLSERWNVICEIKDIKKTREG